MDSECDWAQWRTIGGEVDIWLGASRQQQTSISKQTIVAVPQQPTFERRALLGRAEDTALITAPTSANEDTAWNAYASLQRNDDQLNLMIQACAVRDSMVVHEREERAIGDI